MWQDYVLTAGSIAFVLALIPAIRSPEKPARSTCALTAGVLYTFAVTQWTLDLPFTAITTMATAAAWTVLLFQRRIGERPAFEDGSWKPSWWPKGYDKTA